MDDTKPKKKYKQGPKSGKVLRISDFAWSVIKRRRQDEGQTTREIVDLMLTELHDLSIQIESLLNDGELFFILPKSGLVCESRTEPEAIGEAIRLAVKKGKKRPDEYPIAVRKV